MNRNLLKKDRMRFVKNKASANLAYLAIVFNVLYFISIYSSDVGNYYYSIMIGVSVVYNLLFLLSTFLSSEGLKRYKLSYAIVITVVGALQLVRIFGFPMGAINEVTSDGGRVMEIGQFIYTVAMLCLSAAAAVASGVIGIVRTKALEKYNQSLSHHEA